MCWCNPSIRTPSCGAVSCHSPTVKPKCNCLTKTPEPKFHNKGCPVWLVGRLTSLADKHNISKDLLWNNEI